MTDTERQEIAYLRTQIAEAERRLQATLRAPSADEMNELSAAQHRADAACRRFGRLALPPVPGESPLAYRKRLARDLQPYSAKFKDADVARLDSVTFSPIEEVIYNDAKSAAYDPANYPPGRLVPIPEIDSSGRTVTRYVGDSGVWFAPFTTGGYAGRFTDPRQ